MFTTEREQRVIMAVYGGRRHRLITEKDQNNHRRNAYRFAAMGVTSCVIACFITARRCASAVHAVAVHPSVCSSVRPSVCHKPALYQTAKRRIT